MTAAPNDDDDDEEEKEEEPSGPERSERTPEITLQTSSPI
jgi:hypothetical protein